MATSKAVRVTARNTLHNNYLNAFIGCTVIIMSVIVGLFCASFISEVDKSGIFGDIFFLLLCIFLYAPLILGYLKFVWFCQNNTQPNFGIMFTYFSAKAEYKRMIRFVLLLFVKIAVISFLCNLPAIISGLIGDGILKNITFLDDLRPTFEVLCYVLASLGSILALIISVKYYMAPFLFIADENMDIAEIMHMSVIIARGSSMEFWGLVFSVILYIIAGVLVIPLFFTLPFLAFCYMVHCRFAVAEYNSVC